MKKEIKTLTKAEEEIMQILWQIQKGFVKDIITKIPAPKPAYNTVSTIIRILVTKGFVAYKSYGKTYEYYPIITEDSYKSYATNKLLHKYFNNSIENLVSFFVHKENIDLQEANEIIQLLEKIKKEPS